MPDIDLHTLADKLGQLIGQDGRLVSNQTHEQTLIALIIATEILLRQTAERSKP